MKILIACEFSGRVREAFKAQGHDAWSCDIMPTEIAGQHIQDDVLKYLDKGWDMMIAHPPCTYLSRAGARWWKDDKRKKLADDAAAFVFMLRDADIKRIAIENPYGQLNQRWRYPDQVIHPYMFGEPFSKATCLWLKNLPPLMPTMLEGKYEAWIPANTSYRKKNNIPYGANKHGHDRSRTFQGIADAMALQWNIEN